MQLKRWGLLTIVLVLAVMVAACGGKKNASSDNNQQASSQTASVAEAREIEVVLSDWAITPSSIELRKGEPVKLIVRNDGPTEHDIVIAGLGVNVQTAVLKAGQTQTLTFTPQQSGRIEAYCSVPGHKALGMVGDVIIQ